MDEKVILINRKISENAENNYYKKFLSYYNRNTPQVADYLVAEEFLNAFNNQPLLGKHLYSTIDYKRKFAYVLSLVRRNTEKWQYSVCDTDELQYLLTCMSLSMAVIHEWSISDKKLSLDEFSYLYKGTHQFVVVYERFKNII